MLECVHVLRWLFTRSADIYTCELGLDDDAIAYELRVFRGDQPAGTVLERFRHAPAAFARQRDLEGSLIGDGWTLRARELVRRDRI